ncbi:hypothetical protein HYFRA_00002518 [Hymenoscyphus fraxineus]|uniref:BTB domain-containing protein n=1 Tax=Hymenoscyphus fraxineus TaxID=746836 RepID=A0A9N9PZ22_9HELO|nr:hypothetical protein HYFRA_00002518 [Hymenoscyphus fraxineus]
MASTEDLLVEDEWLSPEEEPLATNTRVHSARERVENFPRREADYFDRPYLSPLVTLVVGPESETTQPSIFQVHEERIIHIPFFHAALKPDAFLEGQERKIRFGEECPDIVSRFVEFVYEGDFFPRTEYYMSKDDKKKVIYMEPRLVVRVSPKPDGVQVYNTSLHEAGVMCGVYVSTNETFRLFEMVVKVLCFAERYGVEALVAECLEKLSFLPIGTKEVTVLAKHVLGSISETRKDVYAFLEEKFALHRLRLPACKSFQTLQNTGDNLVLQGLVRLMSINPLKFDYSNPKLVVCVTEVTVASSTEKYGYERPNVDPRDGLTAGFGAAAVGEVLLVKSTTKNEFFCGLHPHIEHTPKNSDGPLHAFSYPVSSFRSLTWPKQ